MLVPLLVVVALHAAEPFPLDPNGDADLRRLHAAWTAAPTTDAERGEMFARIKGAAAFPYPDWRAVADSYFAWRNAEAAARDARHAGTLLPPEFAQALAAQRPTICTTDTRTEKGLYGVTRSTSKSVCSK